VGKSLTDIKRLALPSWWLLQLLLSVLLLFSALLGSATIQQVTQAADDNAAAFAPLTMYTHVCWC